MRCPILLRVCSIMVILSDVHVTFHFVVMLTTGKAIADWVKNQFLGRLKGEIIKRTALNAVFAAIAVPMEIYQTTGMVIDNEWIRGCVCLVISLNHG